MKVIQKNLQQIFEFSRTGKKDKYAGAKNEIQKSAVFNNADDDTNAIISANGEHLINWIGKVESIGSSHGGKDAYVKVISPNGVIYQMAEHTVAGSNLYKQISLLQEGQQIKFSGILSKSNSSEGKWEISLTERGSLEHPEFVVNFESIEPYNNDGLIVPEMSSVVNTASNLPPSSSAEPSVSVSSGYSGAESSADWPAELRALNLVSLVSTRTPPPSEMSATSRPKNFCFLLSAVLASTATWRANGVPIARAQSNMNDALSRAGATLDDKKLWGDAVTAIYQSSITSAQFGPAMHQECVEME